MFVHTTLAAKIENDTLTVGKRRHFWWRFDDVTDKPLLK